MDNTNTELKKTIKLLNDGKSYLICLTQNPSDDSISAATSLYLGLSKNGKSVSIVCADEIKSNLIGADKIKGDIAVSGDNLIITFPYSEGAVDKIDYYIQGDKFNISIQPTSSKNKLSEKDVEFSQSGGDVDYLIVLDADSLKRLGFIYTENEKIFKDKKIINIDRHITNNYFGESNYIEKSSSSTSELVFDLLEQLKVKIDKDIATNLYYGITSATNNFSSFSVSAKTLETAAKLLRLGASKRLNNFMPTPNIFNKKVRSLNNVEHEVAGSDTEEDQELKPKIFRPGNPGNLSWYNFTWNSKIF